MVKAEADRCRSALAEVVKRTGLKVRLSEWLRLAVKRQADEDLAKR